MHERVYKTQAVVLRRFDFGEAGKQLILYTPALGKLSVLAKGVKRTTSKLAGHLEPLTLSHLVIARGRNLDTVTQAQTVESFSRLRTDPDRLFQGMLVAELLDKLTVEHEENRALWSMFVQTLQRLDAGAEPWTTTTYFQLQLLRLSGYTPELHECVECGGALSQLGIYYSPRLGGLLCGSCRASEATALQLTANAVKVMRTALQEPFEMFARIRIGPPLRAELDSLLGENLRRLLDVETASSAVIEAMRRHGAEG